MVKMICNCKYIRGSIWKCFK